jgi:penicillin-binding protein 1A
MDREAKLQLLAKVGRYLAIALGVGGVTAIIAVVVLLRYYESRLPSMERLRNGYQPAQVTRVLARDGTVLGSIFTERRTVVPFADLPAHVKLAFLAGEDAEFYEHQGLNYFGMVRALLANLKAHSTRQGASTITQQVVKNLLLSPERTYERKIKEAILAKRLEQELSKDEIFALYLNNICLGQGRYGIEEASRYYFGKRARDLDLADAALLAGIAPSPEHFSPRADLERSLQRRRLVLDRMLRKGFVTREVYDAVVNEPVRLSPSSEEESELAPEVVAYVRRSLQKLVGDAAQRGGFTVTTTLDPRLQALARRSIRDGLDAYSTRQKLTLPLTATSRKSWGPVFAGEPKANKIYVAKVTALDDAKGTIDVELGAAKGRVQLTREDRYNPKRLVPSAFAKVGALLRVTLAGPVKAEGPVLPLRLELGPQAALVAIDPRSREVLAAVGNYEAVAGGLDRATQAHRQPGSAFKPFLYGYALVSRRFTPSSVLELAPLKPAKGEDAIQGPRRISVRDAIAQSDNAAAEYLLGAVGAPNVVEWAHALGIDSQLEATPSLALGAYEVTPIELVNAYACFASGGMFEPSHLISKIIGPNGKEIARPGGPPSRRVMSSEEAYLVTSLLRGVVARGTAKRASSLGRPLAGKTGTTNRAKDAWFVGYSTELVAGVWVGYDDAIPLGYGESGGTTALPLWMTFMKGAHEGRPVTDFPKPAGVVSASIDPSSGLLSYPGQENAVEEEFLDGTVPNETARRDPPAVEAQPAVNDEAVEAGRVAEPGSPPVHPEIDGGGVEPPPF